MTAYPADFRCAQITPYSIAVDMGLLRTPMEGGNARQRRLYRNMPHAFGLEFVMTVQELGSWQEWVNEHGYDYFIIDKLESMYAGKKGVISSPHNIRFTSNLAIDNPIYGWVRVKVSAELGGLADLPTLAWIIAGTPALPSAGLPPVSFNLMTGTLPAGSTFARGSTGWYFNSAGTLASVGNNLPRWTYDPTTLQLLGLLNEPAATNSIRNASALGAVPGGATPTYWTSAGSLGSLVRTVIGNGTEDGLPYYEVRVSGTSTPAGSYAFTFEGPTQVAALPGQNWLAGAHVRLVAGSLANVTGMTVRLYGRNSGGSGTTDQGNTTIVPTNAPLRTQWSTTSRVLTDANTAFVQPAVSFAFADNLPVDFTIRIGAPQMVLAALPTSPIITTTVAITRAQDVARVPLEDGTYTLTVQRVEGPTTHVNQSATGGTLRVPVDESPLQSLVATKTAPGVFIIAGTPAAPSAGMIEGGTPATWAL